MLNFASLLSSQNLRAVLRVIREGESSQEDIAYRMLVGGALFDSFADHPRQRIYIARLNVWSTAAGAYQALAGTWDDFIKACGPSDFRPYAQDCFAVWCIYRRGALDDAIRGDLAAVIEKCKSEWASLPGDVYGQGGISMDRAFKVFAEYGGGLNTVVASRPAPIEETDPDGDGRPGVTARPEDVARIQGDTTMAPLVAILGTALTPLLQTLIAGFTTANQSKVTAAMSKAGWESTAAQQFAEQTMTAAKALADQALQAAGLMPPAGAPGAVSQPPPDLASVAEAIAIVKRDPALIAQVEATAMDYVDKMGPLLDKLAELEAREWEANEDSKDRAAKRQHEFVSADGWDMTRTLALGGLGFIGVLATFVCAIAAWQTYLNGVPSTEVWAAITGLIGTAAGILTTIFAFRFGTNRASAAKDVTNAALAGELAARRR